MGDLQQCFSNMLGSLRDQRAAAEQAREANSAFLAHIRAAKPLELRQTKGILGRRSIPKPLDQDFDVALPAPARYLIFFCSSFFRA